MKKVYSIFKLAQVAKKNDFISKINVGSSPIIIGKKKSNNEAIVNMLAASVYGYETEEEAIKFLEESELPEGMYTIVPVYLKLKKQEDE